MKVKVWLSAWLLSFCLSFGTLSALVTAFSLQDISLPLLGLCFLLFCALAAWAFLSKGGTIFLLSFMSVLLLCSLFWVGLLRSVQAVAYEVSIYYDAGYGWGVLDIPVESEHFSQVPAIFLLGMFPAILVSWTVCRKDSLFLPLGLGLLPLYPCFVVTDTPPESWCFFLILGAVLLLVLSQNIRRLNHKAGNRITAFALVPTILLSVFLITAVPQEGYWSEFPLLERWIRTDTDYEEEEDGPPVLSPPSYMGMPEGNRKDLSQVGPLAGTDHKVMVVRSGYGGFLYLRYQSFDRYNGTLWTATNLAEDPACWPEASQLGYLGSAAIVTTQAYEGMFIPYYANDGCYLNLKNGKLPNSESLKEYRISVGTFPANGHSGNAPDLSPYLNLPEATREAALDILRSNDLRTPEDILQYVKNSATYNLNTPAMPEDAEDFAIWFLQSSETGYCTHYATAAAVLLRAAGYPARFVTGYALMTNRGVPTTVTERNAHAWVEYSDPADGYYWQIFEATPENGVSGSDPEPTVPPTEDTTPPTTEAPLPSTQPPTETTLPSQPITEATLPSQSDTVPSSTTTASGTTQAPATAPSSQIGQQSKPQTNKLTLSLLLPWLLGLGILLTGIAALWIQYRIRLHKRMKKQCEGTPNAQALARWQEISLLCRLLNKQPPETLLGLAEKAKFSQHTLTKEELFRLGQYLQLQRASLQALPLWRRLYLKLIWAI